MKKYKVSGTGVHAIKLVECETKPKKTKGVTWFESLEDAKAQLLENRLGALNELLTEKQRLLNQLEITDNHIAILSKPIDLDAITDDFLQQSNDKMKELHDKIQNGEHSVF